MRSQFKCYLAPYLANVMVGSETDAAKWISPLKILEYMASCKPIIASDLPVFREVLEHEFNALLCRPDNLLGWLSALRRVRYDQDICAENALEVIRTKYTWPECILQIVKIDPVI
jgi:glycosyltransferase involved in cell wall biosynthesis